MMSQFNRRDFLRLAGITSGVALGSPLFSAFSNTIVLAQASGLSGKVVITKAGPVNIHTYVAPELGTRVTSHIIETGNQLVMVDAQLLRGAAFEANAYIESLGKPLERIYVSHQHPDHWVGAENFDAPLISTTGVAAGISEYIDTTGTTQLASLLPADQVPESLRLPEVGVEAGSDTIDGVNFEFDVILDAEAPEQIILRIPDAGVIVLQDMLFSNTHMYPLGNRPHWIEVLNDLRRFQAEGYDTLLAGHGVPTTFGEIDAVIDYLNTQDEIIASAETPDQAIATMRERYPNHSANFILDLFVPFRFQS